MSEAEAPVHYASDAANTVKDILQALADGLAPLAQKAQVPLEKLFGWACKMQIAEGVAYLAVALFLLAMMGGIVFFWAKLWPKMSNEGDAKPASLIFSLIAFAGLSLGVGTLCFHSVILLIAPEWSAVEMIVHTVRGH